MELVNFTQKYNLQLYQSREDQDVRLFRWWMQLKTSGDLDSLVLPLNHTPQKFYELFRPPTALIYSLSKENQIQFAIWFTPFPIAVPTAFVALWCAPEMRKSRMNSLLSYYSVKEALKSYKQIFAVIHQRDVELLAKCGYALLGTFPGFYPNEAGLLMMLDAELLAKSKWARLCEAKRS